MKCICWKPTAPFHQIDCPAGQRKRQEQQELDKLVKIMRHHVFVPIIRLDKG